MSLREEAEARRKAAPAAATVAPTASPTPFKATRGSRLDPTFINADDYETGKVGAFVHGAADTISFGFMDEAGAWVDSKIPTWAGGNERTYEENLARNRAILRKYEEEQGGTYMAGQIAGAFVPVFGVAGRAKSASTALKTGGQVGLGRLVVEAGAQGALYGFGSGEGGVGNRMANAATMGVLGAAGGFVLGTAIFQGARVAQAGYRKAVAFRTGKSPRIDLDLKPKATPKAPVPDAVAEDLTSLRQTKARRVPTRADPAAPPVTPAAPKKISRLTGKASDELEQGALGTVDEIVDPVKRSGFLDKFAKLSPQEARVAAAKLTEAMESGDLTKEPHFKSILGFDLSEFGDEEVLIPHVAEILKDMSEEVLAKAKMGSRSVKSVEYELRQRYGGSITEEGIDDLVKKVKDVEGYANMGSMQMVLAGVKFARVTKELMPEVLKGVPEARTLLAEELSTALRISANGQFLVSSAGRNLGILRHSRSLLLKEVGDGLEVESKDVINKRIRAAFDEMDDDTLLTILSSTRDLSKLEEISEVLMNPARTEQINNWHRAMNTLTAFRKSSTMTLTTAAVNFVGVPIHTWMRLTAPRKIAEAIAEASGDVRTQLVLSMKTQAAREVRAHAAREGAKASWNRIKWESFTSWERIAGVAGFGKSALKAKTSRIAMVADGYRPPKIREFDLKKRIALTDVKGFNARLAARAASDVPFANLTNLMERVGATAVNVFDAGGTAMAKFSAGVIDDFGRAYVTTREVYAEMAGKATEEAIDKGLTGDALSKHVSARAKEWATMPPEDILTAAEARLISGEDLTATDKMLLRRDYDADKEADRILFMDGVQTKYGRHAAGLASGLDKAVTLGQARGLLFPFIETPTRILERTFVSYTPWAAKSREVQEVLARGGIEAAVERARMEVGGTVIGVGMLLGASGVLTVTNGGYTNSANLSGAPANRVNLPGGAYIEFGRLEPIAGSVALGAVIGQMWKARHEAGKEYGQDDAIEEAWATAYHGIRDAVLEKAYMTGMSDLVEAWTSPDPESLPRYAAKLYPDALVSSLPMAGQMRQMNETFSGRALEAVGALDILAKATPYMGTYLPARIDPLGNEVANRKFGLAMGLKGRDPVTDQLAALGVNITALGKADPLHFGLTSDELSDLRRIRATEAVNKDGVTMKQALADLFANPTFQTLPDKDMKQDEVTAVMRQFNQSAREIYEMRNQDYLADREARRLLKDYIAGGSSEDEGQLAAQQDIQGLGLGNPKRIFD